MKRCLSALACALLTGLICCLLTGAATEQYQLPPFDDDPASWAYPPQQILLGTTASGSKILALKFSGDSGQSRPALAVVAATGSQMTTGSYILRRMGKLLGSADPAARALLESVDIYLIPQPSPDAGWQLQGTASVLSAMNTTPTDDDRDGHVNEDGPEDLDGDGYITMMRVRDPAGKWRAHPLDPRVLIPIKPELNEQGEYSLYTEGVDNDGDGQFNEDGPGGVDFNKNWTWNYPANTPGAGPWPVSEAETRAVADFLYDRPEIALVYVLGPQDNLAQPWQAGNDGGRIKTGVLAGDAPLLKYISDEYKKHFDTATAPKGEKGDGSFGYWAYFHYGRWSLMAQPWWVPEPVAASSSSPNHVAAEQADAAAKDVTEAATGETVPPAPVWDEKDERGRDDIRRLKWLEEQGIDGFVEWTAAAHPDFPGQLVEVGGFRESLLNSVSGDKLRSYFIPVFEEQAEKQLAFLSAIAGLLPQLSIDNVKTEALGGGVWRIEARLVNTGFLPTQSEAGAPNLHVPMLIATLGLPDGAQLISGNRRTFVNRLAGGGGSTELSWLVSGLAGGGSISLEAGAPNVGSASVEIKLEAAQ